MKRIISMILAVILTVTSLPINLFAEDSYTLTPEQIAELVAGSEIAPIISEDVSTESGDSEVIVDDTISDVSEVVAGESTPRVPIRPAYMPAEYSSQAFHGYLQYPQCEKNRKHVSDRVSLPWGMGL